MRHILNNLSEEEKNSIREQHAGVIKVMTKNFSKLVETEEMSEGIFDRKLSKTEKLKRDIIDVITRKVARAEPTGVQGKWAHSEVEKSFDQILNDIEDVVSRYRVEES